MNGNGGERGGGWWSLRETGDRERGGREWERERGRGRGETRSPSAAAAAATTAETERRIKKRRMNRTRVYIK